MRKERSQRVFIEKMNQYFVVTDRKDQELSSGGCCNAMAALWGAAMIKGTERADFYTPIARICDTPRTQITGINPIFEYFLTEKEGRKSLVVIQNPGKYLKPGLKQTDLHKTLPVQKKFSVALPLTLAGLEVFLQQFIRPGTLCHVVGLMGTKLEMKDASFDSDEAGHAIGVYQRGKRFYVMDPNYFNGCAKEFDTLKQVAEELQKQLFTANKITASEVMAIELHIFSGAKELQISTRYEDRTETIKKLLENKEHTAHTTSTGIPGLFLAAKVGDVDTVRLFIKKNVDVNQLWGRDDNSFKTALYIALREGQFEVVAELLKVPGIKIINPSITARFGNIINFALNRGDLLLVKHILDLAQAEHKEHKGHAEDKEIVESSDILTHLPILAPTVSGLINQDGSEVNLCNAPLYYLVLKSLKIRQKMDDLASISIKSIKFKDSQAEYKSILQAIKLVAGYPNPSEIVFNSLRRAIIDGDLKTIIAIMDGARWDIFRFIELKPKPYTTVCMLAVRLGHIHIIKHFLEHLPPDQSKKLLEQRDSNGNTLMCLAIASNQAGQLEIMQLLRQYGARLDITNKQGDTLLHAVSQGADEAAFDWILKQQPGTLNAENDKKETALHLAAQIGHAPYVKKLLKASHIRWAKLDKNGMTPLHLAVKVGHIEVIQLFFREKRINVDTFTDSQGNTLLLCACQYSSKKDMGEIVSYLLLRGASPKIADSTGKSPLEFAVENDACSVVELLLAAIKVYVAPGDRHPKPFSDTEYFKLTQILAESKTGHSHQMFSLILNSAPVELELKQKIVLLRTSIDRNNPTGVHRFLDQFSDLSKEMKQEKLWESMVTQERFSCLALMLLYTKDLPPFYASFLKRHKAQLSINLQTYVKTLPRSEAVILLKKILHTPNALKSLLNDKSYFMVSLLFDAPRNLPWQELETLLVKLEEKKPITQVTAASGYSSATR